jgi:Rieske Fe-S protein
MQVNDSGPLSLSRRRVLAAGAGAAVGVAGLAACGGSSDGEATTTSEPGSSKDASAGLVDLADVPVGGAVSATGRDGGPVIVAQPRRGHAVAFSAVCTHRGCTVAPAEDELECPCHGSTYDLTTGENTGGPAPSPLEQIQVKVVDGVVMQA